MGSTNVSDIWLVEETSGFCHHVPGNIHSIFLGTGWGGMVVGVGRVQSQQPVSACAPEMSLEFSYLFFALSTFCHSFSKKQLQRVVWIGWEEKRHLTHYVFNFHYRKHREKRASDSYKLEVLIN